MGQSEQENIPLQSEFSTWVKNDQQCKLDDGKIKWLQFIYTGLIF